MWEFFLVFIPSFRNGKQILALYRCACISYKMCEIVEACFGLCSCFFQTCDACCLNTNGCSSCGSCDCGNSGEQYGSGQSSGPNEKSYAPQSQRRNQPPMTTAIPVAIPIAIPIKVMNRDVNIQF